LKKVFYDIEVYPNFWCVVFANENGDMYTIDSNSNYIEDLEKLEKITRHRLFVGFNNNHYDAYILQILLNNKHNKKLTTQVYEATQDLIVHEEYGLKVLKKYCGQEAKIKTFQLDLMMMSPQRLSLKEYGVRMHHHKLQTIPVAPDTEVDFLDVVNIIEYCKNDVEITKLLHDELFHNEVQIKDHLIQTFNLSPSAYAQSNRKITEDVLCDPNLKPLRKAFSYEFPYGFQFDYEEFNFLKETYENIDFSEEAEFKSTVDYHGLQIDYGLGGLHGVVKNYQGENLIDIDVASYYPNLVRNLNALPQTVKDPQAFYAMIDDRIKLKKTDPAKATAYKVLINTVYGAMNYSYGNRLGQLYDIENLYKITITGQLLLTKLIEMLHDGGYRVVYANTDGVMIEDNGTKDYKAICESWEELTSLELEFSPISKAIIKDVNNYIVTKKDGELKVKGVYADEAGTKTHAYARIANKAVIHRVLHDKPIEETVRESTDIRDFVLYHKFSSQYSPTHVVDRKTKQEYPFERVIRYYLADDQDNYLIAYNNNTGSWIRKENSENISVISELPEEFPTNIDYSRYIDIAYDMLEDLTGKEVEHNPYIEAYLEALQEAFK
jgi:hypothetical protein